MRVAGLLLCSKDTKESNVPTLQTCSGPFGGKVSLTCEQLGEAEQAHAGAEVDSKAAQGKVKLGARVLLVDQPQAQAGQVAHHIALPMHAAAQKLVHRLLRHWLFKYPRCCILETLASRQPRLNGLHG